MQSVLYHPIDSPRIQNMSNAADNQIDMMILVDLSNRTQYLTLDYRLIRKPKPAIKGTVDNFKPKIHELVPELKNLTDEELEKLIGESNKFDFDMD